MTGSIAQLSASARPMARLLLSSAKMCVVSSTAASESMVQCENEQRPRTGIVETKPESTSPPAASPAPAVLQAERTTQSALSFN
jgi:hypothetical protein